MKAIGFNRNGGPEVLEEMEVQDPVPAPGEIVVRPSYTSMNNLDAMVRSGQTRPPGMQMPHVPGSDIVGTVEGKGPGASGVEEGDRVVVNPLYGCGSCTECRNGTEVLCQSWKSVGIHSWGSYAELVKVPCSTAIRAPDGVADMDLGCMPICLSVSWRSLHWASAAREGETVVVRGASGNAGIFLMLLSKATGLETIAITRSAAKEQELRRIGADRVVVSNGDDEETAREVMAMTGSRGADIVCDPFGTTIPGSISMLRHGGRLVTFGVLSGKDVSMDMKRYYWKSIRMIGVHHASTSELAEALAFVAEKGVKPVIAKKLRIRDAQEAHRLFASSSLVGKISMRHEW